MTQPKHGRDQAKLLLFVPIETKAREMDAKVLLACVAAERGHRTVIGDMKEIAGFAEYLPRGVYISKSIPDKVERLFVRLKTLGYRVSGWCEEGLVFRSREDYKREKVSSRALQHLDLFFAWGGDQARAITEKVPEARDKIHEVGNPRTDLIRPPYKEIYRQEADSLLSTYGSFILFNTNFSIANSILGTQEAFADFKKRGKVASSADEQRYWRFHDHKLNLLEQMKQLVRDVSRAYPERKVIIRPHPSENHDTWRECASDLNNVEVVFTGSVVPWLMAADVLIHNGCTTAIEAYYLETPAIAYRPVVKQGFELELPNSTSFQATTADEVCRLIASLARGECDYRRLRCAAAEALAGHMADAETGWASDRVVEALERYYTDHPVKSELFPYRWIRWGGRRAVDGLRSVKHVLQGRDAKQAGPGARHRDQKLPGLDIGEVRSLVARLAEASGRFHNVEVKPIRRTQRCFVVARRR